MRGIRAAVRALFSQDPGLTIRQISDRTGYSYVQVKKALAYIKDPERHRVAKQQYLRTTGVRPAAAVAAERRRDALKISRPVLVLRKEGKSFSAIANELGLTRNQVAGRVRRSRLTSQLRSPQEQ
jgi:hypothetical protein